MCLEFDLIWWWNPLSVRCKVRPRSGRRIGSRQRLAGERYSRQRRLLCIRLLLRFVASQFHREEEGEITIGESVPMQTVSEDGPSWPMRTFSFAWSERDDVLFV